MPVISPRAGWQPTVMLEELNSELTNDPYNAGYAVPIAAGDMQATADMMNVPRGDASPDVQVLNISREAMLVALDLTECELLPAPLLNYAMFLLDRGFAGMQSGAYELSKKEYDMGTQPYNIASVFNENVPTAGGVTVTALNGMGQKVGTRAEELWGD